MEYGHLKVKRLPGGRVRLEASEADIVAMLANHSKVMFNSAIEAETLNAQGSFALRSDNARRAIRHIIARSDAPRDRYLDAQGEVIA